MNEIDQCGHRTIRRPRIFYGLTSCQPDPWVGASHQQLIFIHGDVNSEFPYMEMHYSHLYIWRFKWRMVGISTLDEWCVFLSSLGSRLLSWLLAIFEDRFEGCYEITPMEDHFVGLSMYNKEEEELILNEEMFENGRIRYELCLVGKFLNDKCKFLIARPILD